MRRLAVVLLLATLTVGGCHRQRPENVGGSLRNVITQGQIDSTDASSVYDLVIKLRPDFFRDRGKISINNINRRDRPIVFLNGQEYGIIETLRNMPPNRLSEIRFYPGTEAAAQFGSQYGGGVINCVSRVE